MFRRNKLTIFLILTIIYLFYSGYSPPMLKDMAAVARIHAGSLVNGAAFTQQETPPNRFGIIRQISAVRGDDCIPKYASSAFLGNGTCFTEVEVGPVIVERGFYKVNDMIQCSYILSVAVRSAFQGEIYNSCISGDFI